MQSTDISTPHPIKKAAFTQPRIIKLEDETDDVGYSTAAHEFSGFRYSTEGSQLLSFTTVLPSGVEEKSPSGLGMSRMPTMVAESYLSMPSTVWSYSVSCNN